MVFLYYLVILFEVVFGTAKVQQDSVGLSSPIEWFQLTSMKIPGLGEGADGPQVVYVDIPPRNPSSDVAEVRVGYMDLILHRNRGLLHPHFVILRRHGNGTSIVTTEAMCSFKTPPDSEVHAAADICDGMHGIIYMNGRIYRIQPLNRRYWTSQYYNIPHLLQHLTWNPYASNTTLAPEKFLDDLKTKYSPWNQPTMIQSHRNITGEQYELFARKKRSAYDRRFRKDTSPQEVKIETAVFVDRDLLRYMQTVFPTDTERHLLRFVLAMFNAVQLLYHDSSLGTRVDFVLKRLEILHSEPAGLQRPSDIDRYLNSFCIWQNSQQPRGQSHMGWDHALMLTGLDLYVISKGGRISSQVVGLAPVAGMCLPRSSCTVNEGRHFESVFVVAHEMGHNLGMRHDGPSADNTCDSSEYIMAPTLGSGRFTWSSCSRRYLLSFLQSQQAQCLFQSSGSELDHIEGGALPGERFDSNMQCMLKHGPGSVHAPQSEADMCKDLRCTKERFTWNTHPALEGTVCKSGMWCRGGQCVPKDSVLRPTTPTNGGWSEWSPLSECASACLDDPNVQGVGSTGISVAFRRCNNPRPENGGQPCFGSDKKYQTCKADQCLNVSPTTINDFAEAICRRARDVEKDLTGKGKQRRTPNREEACTVWCDTQNGGAMSKGWIFPDGTECGENSYSRKHMFCIAGKCEEFECQRNVTFIAAAQRCMTSTPRIQTKWMPVGPCHSNCIAPGRGLRILKRGGELNIQLCHLDKACGRTRSVYDYANKICSKFSERVKKLSGLGLQLTQVAEDPDRPCQVACQDTEVQSRFYLVTGEEGWFPFGTDCSRGLPQRKAYCVSGKCLEFGDEDTPLLESQFVFPNIKRKRSLQIINRTVVAKLDGAAVARLIEILHAGSSGHWDSTPSTSFTIDWDNPVHVEQESIPADTTAIFL